MCGRYDLIVIGQALAARFGVAAEQAGEVTQGWQPRFNIAPSQLNPVVVTGMTANDQENIANFVKTARSSMAESNRAAAKAFLAQNGKKKDVVTTASGLQYHVITEGQGAPPKSTDEVTVHYRGTLLDGTEFDSSYKRGQPASFPVNGVIQGWQEALMLMKPGAKWELFIPPNLAYDVNSPPAIPPGSLLKFDVELIKVSQPTPAVPGAKVPKSQ